MCVCACVRVCVCKTDRRHSASDVFDNVQRTIDMHRVHKATDKKNILKSKYPSTFTPECYDVESTFSLHGVSPLCEHL
jgi:hypothetical protein